MNTTKINLHQRAVAASVRFLRPQELESPRDRIDGT